MEYKCPKCGSDELRELAYGIVKQVGFQIIEETRYDVLYDEDYFGEAYCKYECPRCFYQYIGASTLDAAILQMRREPKQEIEEEARINIG